jgi:hypothetical protein
MGRLLHEGTTAMSITKTLSDAQLQVLTAGAARLDRMLLPLPATIRARGGARRNLLAALLKTHLVEEVQAEDAAIAWRTDEADRPIGLRLTAAGFAAIGAPDAAPAPQESDRSDQQVRESEAEAEATASIEGDASEVEQCVTAEQDVAGTHPPRRPTGKLGEVLQAISAETGATLPELTSLTGWLPHTARAAVTGLRQRGFPIALIQQDGRKAYRLTDAG